MDAMDTLCVKGRREWRNWLHKNAAKCEEVWLVYYKNASGQSGISYEDSVEEAVCFGWIDGKIRKLDELRYARRFTPRKSSSQWSASNIRRVERLTAEGKMTAAGLASFSSVQRAQTPPMPTTRLPKELEARLKKQLVAWENFQSFPAYYRRMTAGWVASAKRKETRLKRLEKLIEFSARNERIQFM
jgi:uncharacterized protein YdeI (YjbR/CyaY-like superfamily)